jgi:site-specific recombinase XerD
MSIRIQYAYLKQQTWIYRRNYPLDVRPLLGVPVFKQSLQTGDAKAARVKVAELNAAFEDVVAKARRGIVALPQRRVFKTKVLVGPAQAKVQPGNARIGDLCQQYLNKRSMELRHGGFKSVRFSIGLFRSSFGERTVGSLSRDDARLFLQLVSELSPHVGKSERTRGLGLAELVALSKDASTRITPQTQRRIVSQVGHLLDWVVYEGHLDASPFRSVRVEQKARTSSYAVPSDDEVCRILRCREEATVELARFCLFSGMRAGEAAGLLRDDLVTKGNHGIFVRIRPNSVRLLKTDAAEREVPLHPFLGERLSLFPSQGRLFPDLSVAKVTKRFARLRRDLGLDRPGLVFHSTRKWFITQCERGGVPEHFTATLVGHQSARSENRLTYSIYSAGISDEQKRAIVDAIPVPEGL